MTMSRIALVILLVAAISAFFAFDLGQYLTLEYFKSQQQAIEAYRQSHPLATARSLVRKAVVGG